MTGDVAHYAINLQPSPRIQPPVVVGGVRQLFVDDFFLARASGHWDQYAHNVHFTLGRVAKHGEPILQPEAPWEARLGWVSVLREAGGFRLWYDSFHPDDRCRRVSYAESDDGIHFSRPLLGLFEINGTRANNVVFDGGFLGVSPNLGNVFLDPNAIPGEAYKMLYGDWHGSYRFELPNLPGIATNGTLRGASSPDGIHWTRYAENFLGYRPDTQNAAGWDPTLRKYVAYHRTHISFAGLNAGALRVAQQPRGRAVGRIESDDFRQWTVPETALAPDIVDGLNVEIYNNAYSRHPDNPNVHYLFPSFYHRYEGTFHVQVATSRDNRTWQRPCRETFIPLGAPGEFDCFMIAVAPGIVAVDGDTWALYYRATDRPHPGARPMTLSYEWQHRVGRVTFSRDRIVGIEGGREGGRFSTRPVAFDGSRLILNAEPTGPDPEIRVQLLSAHMDAPITGYTFDECRPIGVGGLDCPVAWDQGDVLGSEVPRAAVRLHVALRQMRLYAFQFVP